MGATTYHGESRLATGGMAAVMMAVERAPGGIPCLVVLKRLLPHLAEDSDTVQDFLDEARMMAALHHANIVNVRDLGRDDTGFYIVQEYLSGENLRAVVAAVQENEMAVPVPIACRIAAEVGAALQYCHRASDARGDPMNLVHRDISPGNIVLTYDGRIKLIDFGVAKSALRQRTTRPGVVKGQPAYVAPESLRGEPVDHRADIFSLGVVLYEMLTGRSLFLRQNPAAVLDAILHEPIPPARDLNPRVPEALDAVVSRAVDRDPAGRYPSAGQMREALEEVLRSVNLTVGPRQLAGWVQTSLADARRTRIDLERSVQRKAGVIADRLSRPTNDRAKPRRPAPAPAPNGSSAWPVIAMASLFALLLLLLVFVAFLIGRAEANGPGMAGT